VARVVQAGRGRRWLIIAGVALVLLLAGFTALSGFFVDLLWFREVGFSQVFWTILRTKIALGLIFGAAFFAILYANLLIVRLLTPSYRAIGPEQEVIERYRLAFEPYAWWLLPVIAGVIALFVGLGATYGGSLVFDYGFNVETAGDSPVWHKSEIDVFSGDHD